MAKSTKPAKERKCRNNIAMLLSLMGFKDENPAATVKIMLAKLKNIQEKPKFKKPVVNKITFKCGGKTATVSLKPLALPHSFDFNAGNHQITNDDDGGCMGLHKFIRNMGGSEAKLVIEKELTSSDVKKALGRLLIPQMNVKNSRFLTSDEKRKLGNGKDISVPVFDLERHEWTVNLTRWNMNKEVYVLKTGWNSIVNTIGLRQGVVIKVWAFRVKGQLCIALVRV